MCRRFNSAPRHHRISNLQPPQFPKTSDFARDFARRCQLPASSTFADAGIPSRELDPFATPEQVASWSRDAVEDWATESLADARLAYRLPGTDRLMESGTKLGEEYCRFAPPFIHRHLAKA